jgi:hypothetical protein
MMGDEDLFLKFFTQLKNRHIIRLKFIEVAFYEIIITVTCELAYIAS